VFGKINPLEQKDLKKEKKIEKTSYITLIKILFI
jgi:hypothetical protein